MARVLVIGAGFSRAISSKFPLTDQLGDMVMSARSPGSHSRPTKKFAGGYFETWLSRLAEAQPDLDDYANALNRAEFLHVTEDLHRVLTEQELRVLDGPPPEWLTRLIRIAQAQRLTLITFNYDLFIEYTLMARMVYDWQNFKRVLPENAINNIPPYAPAGMRFGTEHLDSFDLIKLHGSLDTYWVPGDSSGATINRMPLAATWGRPEALDLKARQSELPGRSAFIIPPAAAKSSFYNNPVTRQLWRSAAEALRQSDRVALLGYSLPPTDLVTSGMLAETLSDHAVTIDIVNPSPGQVVEHLEAIGLEPAMANSYGGDAPISSYVDELEREASISLATNIKPSDPERGLVVSFAGGPYSYRVTSIRSEGGNVVLSVGSMQPRIEVATAATPTHEPKPILDRELVAQIEGSPNGELIVEYADGSPKTARIVDTGLWQTPVGAGNGFWLVLVPSISPDEESRPDI